MKATALIRLDEGDLLLAAAWQDAILAKDLERRPNYTGLHAQGRFFVGYLGEIAVARLLALFGVWHSHRVALTARTDAPELVAMEAGRRVSLEVKTASEPTHQRLMFPAAQHDRLASYFVGARVEGLAIDHAHVSVLGWIPASEAHALPVADFGKGVPTRSALFTDLRPIGELLTRLAPVRQIEREAA